MKEFKQTKRMNLPIRRIKEVGGRCMPRDYESLYADIPVDRLALYPSAVWTIVGSMCDMLGRGKHNADFTVNIRTVDDGPRVCIEVKRVSKGVYL